MLFPQFIKIVKVFYNKLSYNMLALLNENQAVYCDNFDVIMIISPINQEHNNIEMEILKEAKFMF